VWLDRKTGDYETWSCFASVSIVLAATCGAQTTGYLAEFFKQNIGLKDSEIARIEQGRAIAKVLDSPKASQVFVFGAICINAQADAYVRLARNLDRLKSLPGYLEIQPFSNPPVRSDLSAFRIDADRVAFLLAIFD
jgi:hypothetical protein